ncbi:MAG: hypothetical protein V4669_04015 [Pseudomonadota bacterium]
MKSLIICAALAVAAPVMAQNLVARQGDDSIRLADAPCASEVVLEKIPEQFHSQLRQATATVDGHTFSACWRKAGAAAHLIYEDGDQGIVPLSDMKPELAA